jgi:heterodisulfide reductase subunit A
MRAALSLAQRDVAVDLLEIEDELGGTLAKHPSALIRQDEVDAWIWSLRNQIATSTLIRVHLGTRVVSSTVGPSGRDTLLRTKSGADLLVSHGATLLATGGHGAGTTSYGYGTCDRILTQTELESRLGKAGLDDPHTVVMIQCVDSRVSDGHAYCSRICCPRALENAKRLQSLHPGIRIVVLYRDMMACGAWEHAYTEARRSGVLFVRYDVTDKPTVVIDGGKPVVTTIDPVLGSPLQVRADWLVLSTAIEPSDSAGDMARIFGVRRDRTGFFREADSKWRPVELTREGVYAAGTGHGPQPLPEVLAQAEAAAQQAFEHLRRARSQDDPSRTHTVATVHPALCAQCGQCVDACVFHARRLDEGSRRILVDPLACRLCGACATACPNGAARLGVMGERQVMAQLDAALEGALDADLDGIPGRTA